MNGVARTVLLSAGGTGGHLFPAEALARALVARGWIVHLATDHRVESYGQDFPAAETHVIRSATPSVRSPVAMAKALWSLYGGYRQAKAMLRRVRPAAVVGFGGYPTVPPLLAAAHLHIPTLVHDANAVLGRANRLLAPRVTVLATSFTEVGHTAGLRTRILETGNPVRPAVIAASRIPYEPPQPGGSLRLLVFGGSQGARFFSDVMPQALAKLDATERGRLSIVQQCRPEDIERVRAAYAALGIAADLAPFFRDLPARIAASHLVLSRSGASTVSELSVIGRPGMLVPLPHAIDQDQSVNAAMLAKVGGGWIVPQASLTADRLAGEISGFLTDPTRLIAAAAAARTVGRPDAVERLADLVDTVAATSQKGMRS